MDFHVYLSYRMEKDGPGCCCLASIENGATGNILNLSKIDNEGHYVDGCLQLITEWLVNKQDVINQLPEPIWVNLNFHRSASNVKLAFTRVKDTVNQCTGLSLADQKILTKQKLTYKNYTKPVSYWSQVELVKTLVRLEKVHLTCQTASGDKIARAYLLACGRLQEHRETVATTVHGDNVIAFPSPQQNEKSLGS